MVSVLDWLSMKRMKRAKQLLLVAVSTRDAPPCGWGVMGKVADPLAL